MGKENYIEEINDELEKLKTLSPRLKRAEKLFLESENELQKALSETKSELLEFNDFKTQFKSDNDSLKEEVLGLKSNILSKLDLVNEEFSKIQKLKSTNDRLKEDVSDLKNNTLSKFDLVSEEFSKIQKLKSNELDIRMNDVESRVNMLNNSLEGIKSNIAVINKELKINKIFFFILLFGMVFGFLFFAFW